MSKGHLIVISGPSGAGKGTLVKRLIQDVANAWISVSATTRCPRKGEVDGRDYFFMSREMFEKKIKQNRFLEWAEYDSNLYGTPLDSVLEHIEAGDEVILEIEVQGATAVKKRMPECKMVFVEPPSLAVLEERLRGRGTNSEESIRARMQTAKLELSHKLEYDKLLVNDDFNIAAKELADYVTGLTD